MKVLSLAALAALVLSSPAFAHPSGHEGGGYYRPTTAVAPTPTVIPDTYPGVVAALRERATVAQTALDTVKVADLRRACGNIMDLAIALPVKAGGLPADARATVAATSARVQQKVLEVMTTAEKGDMVGAKAAIAAISADVDVLRGFVK